MPAHSALNLRLAAGLCSACSDGLVSTHCRMRCHRASFNSRPTASHLRVHLWSSCHAHAALALALPPLAFQGGEAAFRLLRVSSCSTSCLYWLNVVLQRTPEDELAQILQSTHQQNIATRSVTQFLCKRMCCLLLSCHAWWLASHTVWHLLLAAELPCTVVGATHRKTSLLSCVQTASSLSRGS